MCLSFCHIASFSLVFIGLCSVYNTVLVSHVQLNELVVYPLHEIKRHLHLGRKSMTNLGSILKSRDVTLLTKVCVVKAMVFTVIMWQLDRKEGWELMNWCFQIMVLEKTSKSPLDSKRIKPVNRKGNQPWLLIGRTDAEAVFQYFGQYLASWCVEPTHWERPWCWERWRQEEKGKTEDEVVGWHHWLNEHESEQSRGDGEGQGSWRAAFTGSPNQTWLSNWTAAIADVGRL